MTKNDRFTWAVEQMTRVGADEDQKRQVQELLETYWKNEDTQVLDMFTSLAQGKALLEDALAEKWLPATPGNVFVRDVVRVKDDAYSEKDRRNVHNGRVGVVVGIRYGTVAVHYTDADVPPASFTQHRLQLLEKRY